MSRREPWLLLAMGLLGSPAAADWPQRVEVHQRPTPAAFSTCSGYSCETVTPVSLAPEDWQQVRTLFQPAPADAAAERQQIAAAVGLLESLVGQLNGTAADKAGNWAGFGRSGQMDCGDESTNTPTYLRMLEQDQLLGWHSAGGRVTRGWMIFGWPHWSASIEERQTGERFAVDSWFHDNGQAAEVVPLQEWKAGWRPETPITTD